MNAAAELAARIVAAGGAIRFDEFMDLALYGDHGFYTSGVGRAGRRGDFITSPEVGPLFGAVLARALDTWWEELGAPDDFHVYDVGAGPGTLARTVLAAAPRCLGGDPGRYVGVEISAAQRTMHPDGITSLPALPGGTLCGVVLANELLDNVPFRLLVNDGHWREAWVAVEGSSFTEVLVPIDVDLGTVMLPAVHGARVPWQDRAVTWVEDLRRRLDGRLVLIDYAVATTAELANRPWREWLRTYAVHGRGAHYLRQVGEQDITADVCLDQLVARVGEPDAVRSQVQFLQRWGIEDLVAEGRRIWQEEASRPGLRAMTMRSRISEADALCDPQGLGGFTVVEYHGLGTRDRTGSSSSEGRP
ncbi:MAG: SAM-dependent methyltransferase [Ilumatobacteraceae bacterium]